jgi:hypothetical protein
LRRGAFFEAPAQHIAAVREYILNQHVVFGRLLLIADIADTAGSLG